MAAKPSHVRPYGTASLSSDAAGAERGPQRGALALERADVGALLGRAHRLEVVAVGERRPRQLDQHAQRAVPDSLGERPS